MSLRQVTALRMTKNTGIPFCLTIPFRHDFHYKRRGAAVAEWLAYSPPTKAIQRDPGSIPGMATRINNNLPPLPRRLGRITKTLPGSDGIVQVAQVLTQQGVETRHAVKCPLPCSLYREQPLHMERSSGSEPPEARSCPHAGLCSGSSAAGHKARRGLWVGRRVCRLQWRHRTCVFSPPPPPPGSTPRDRPSRGP
ncbi:hypothetical protein PR048_021119 [Dryococelus australis]|uniref:DUF5641 domain-containing protein n=1 Tax=Dryococelus australis TaxID=614101 RepID=A0ABQ9GXD0_9NEOP|nr:hypothetical protein PR048_021119 [Dryococelus australis]